MRTQWSAFFCSFSFRANSLVYDKLFDGFKITDRSEFMRALILRLERLSLICVICGRRSSLVDHCVLIVLAGPVKLLIVSSTSPGQLKGT